jgi:hypothetical protein
MASSPVIAMHFLNNDDIQAVRLDASLAATLRYLGAAVEPTIGIIRPIDIDGPAPSLALAAGVEGAF